MPALEEGQTLRPENFSMLFKNLLMSILTIFKGEQLRVQDSGVEVVLSLFRNSFPTHITRSHFISTGGHMKQNPLNGGHTYPVIQMHAYLLYVKIKFITLKQLSNTCNVLSRKLQSKYSLFLLPKSVMSALPHALDGLMQHAKVQ